MKKNQLITVLFTALSLLYQSLLFSQDTHNTKSFPQNEIKLNLFNTIVWYYPELNYERAITDEKDRLYGLGLSAATFLGTFSQSGRIGESQWHIIPYGRFYYMNSKKTAAFFIEGNMAVFGEKDEIWNPHDWSHIVVERNTKFGLGFAIGRKFFNINNFVGEIVVGIGRSIGGDEFHVTYTRGGISIGYRF